MVKEVEKSKLDDAFSSVQLSSVQSSPFRKELVVGMKSLSVTSSSCCGKLCGVLLLLLL